MQNSKSQSVIISGESSLRKTETAKIPAQVPRRGGVPVGPARPRAADEPDHGELRLRQDRVEQQLVALRQVPHAAVQRRGGWGARIQTGLLEKSRIVNAAERRAELLVLYQVAAGLPKRTRATGRWSTPRRGSTSTPRARRPTASGRPAVGFDELKGPRHDPRAHRGTDRRRAGACSSPSSTSATVVRRQGRRGRGVLDDTTSPRCLRAKRRSGCGGGAAGRHARGGALEGDGRRTSRRASTGSPS